MSMALCGPHAAVAVAALDSNGSILWIFFLSFFFCADIRPASDAEVIESCALKLAIQLWLEKKKKLKLVVIESDCQALINHFKDPCSMCDWRAREMLVEARNLASAIPLLPCSWIPEIPTFLRTI